MVTVSRATRLQRALVLIVGIVLLVPAWMYADQAQYIYDDLS
jgi:hypothetical protein